MLHHHSHGRQRVTSGAAAVRSPRMSPCFAGHDSPHFGKTIGLSTARDFLGIAGVALVDRRYDLVVTRRLELFPDDLEVGSYLGVSASHTGKYGIKLSAGRLHLRIEGVLRGLVLGVDHRPQGATRV